MIVNQSSLRGLNVSYSTAFNKAFAETPTNYTRIATTIPSATAETSYRWLGQMPQMREWVGERVVQALAAYDYSIKNKKFEMTIGVPREDIEDDQYGVYAPMFSNMGESAAMHPEQLTFGAMKNGFEEKCFDGCTFYSDKHPSGKDGKETAGNLSHEKLNQESYVRARTSMMSLKGDNGKSLNLVPDLLVVSPANESMGRQILEAEYINGSSNVYRGTAELMVSTELADKPEAWFLLCTKRFLKPFIYQKRKEIKFVNFTKDTDQNVFLNDEFIWGADGRSNAGYGFWQMAYGSTGTAQG